MFTKYFVTFILLVIVMLVFFMCVFPFPFFFWKRVMSICVLSLLNIFVSCSHDLSFGTISRLFVYFYWFNSVMLDLHLWSPPSVLLFNFLFYILLKCKDSDHPCPYFFASKIALAPGVVAPLRGYYPQESHHIACKWRS